MKRFMLLHYGFEKPTPEIMTAWNEWFQSLGEASVENGGFHKGGHEISHAGTAELPFGPDSMTGYSIIKADSIEAAKEIAQANPFVKSIRVYEIVSQ